MLQDLLFALRLVAKRPWFAGVAVFTLAVGIGLNASVFTLVNAILIRDLPFADSGRLYVVSPQDRHARSRSMSRSEFEEVRIRTRSFTGLAAFQIEYVNVNHDRGIPERVSAARMTANAFGILGQTPLIGRDFEREDEQKGAERVVMLGHGLWTTRYGRDPSIVGRTLRLNGEPFTIVGVMPPGMKFPTTAELWTPIGPTDRGEERRRVLTAFGRLGPGVGAREAQADLDVAASTLSADAGVDDGFNRIRLQTFNERFSGGDIRRFFLTMLGAVGFVVFIACANVANLLLSRSAQRAREMSLRMVLGATRARVIRQLLIESVVLASMGGMLGLVLAMAGVRVFDAAQAGPLKPYWIQSTIDYVVIAYLAALCLGCAILFGLAPALQVSRTNMNELIKEGGPGCTGGRRTRWLTGTIVVAEIAITVVLLAGAGLLVRSMLKLYSFDLGYRTEHLIVMRMELLSSKYRSTEARRAFYDRLLQHVRTIPGTEDAALTTSVPPIEAGRQFFEIEGRAQAPESLSETMVVSISPGFFDVLKVPLRRGRAFADTDGVGGEAPIVINERLAAQYFAGQNPIGQRIRFTRRDRSGNMRPGGWRTIVGIGPDLRHRWPEEMEQVIYTPHRQEAESRMALVVRSRVEAETIVRAVQREVQALDRDQPVFMAETIDEMLTRQRRTFSAFGGMLILFAVVAVLMATVGLYAVVASSVSQRMQEIGIRIALGAEPQQVTWLVLRRGVIQLGAGLAIGVPCALTTSRLLTRPFGQVTPTDPITLLTIIALLSGVAIAACLVAARRATLIDPLSALRAE